MIDVEIETWCSKKKRMKLIMLMCEEKDTVGMLVKGKPSACSDMLTCSKGKMCLLNALSIETNRNKVVI